MKGGKKDYKVFFIYFNNKTRFALEGGEERRELRKKMELQNRIKCLS